MTEYKIIVFPTDLDHAKMQFLAWLDQHKTVRDRLLLSGGPDGSDDLLMDHIVGEGGRFKYQYRIRQSILDETQSEGSQIKCLTE
jgi:hypothetical protein